MVFGTLVVLLGMISASAADCTTFEPTAATIPRSSLNCAVTCAGHLVDFRVQLETLQEKWCPGKPLNVTLEYCSLPKATIPENFFSGAFMLGKLTIQHCNLAYLEGAVFNQPSLEHLHSLIIERTDIMKLDDKTFEGLKAIKYLKLHNLCRNGFSGSSFLAPLATSLEEVVLLLNDGLFSPTNWLEGVDLVALSKVDLSGSIFTAALKSAAFESMVQVQQLILFNCSIETIEVGTFDALMGTLRHLDLRANRLKSLDWYFLTIIATPAFVLQLQGNEWDCSCKNYELIMATKASSIDFVDFPLCVSPSLWKDVAIQHVKLECEGEGSLAKTKNVARDFFQTINEIEVTTRTEGDDKSDETTTSQVNTRPANPDTTTTIATEWPIGPTTTTGKSKETTTEPRTTTSTPEYSTTEIPKTPTTSASTGTETTSERPATTTTSEYSTSGTTETTEAPKTTTTTEIPQWSTSEYSTSGTTETTEVPKATTTTEIPQWSTSEYSTTEAPKTPTTTEGPQFVHIKCPQTVSVWLPDSYLHVGSISPTSVRLLAERKTLWNDMNIFYFLPEDAEPTKKVSSEVCKDTQTHAECVIQDLASNQAYVFCLMKRGAMEQDELSPFNCRSHFLEQEPQSNAWLLKSDRPVFFSVAVILSILCMVLGFVLTYWVLRLRPTLLRDSERIKRASDKSRTVLLYPKKRSPEQERLCGVRKSTRNRNSNIEAEYINTDPSGSRQPASLRDYWAPLEQAPDVPTRRSSQRSEESAFTQSTLAMVDVVQGHPNHKQDIESMEYYEELF